jgi:hypothetical protein
MFFNSFPNSMTNDQMQSGDEISLATFKNTLANFLRLFFKFWAFIAGTLIRQKYALLLSIFLGIACGYIYYILAPKYYKTEMIVLYNDLSKKTYSELINNLNELIISKSSARFAAALKLPETATNNIIKLQLVGLNNETFDSDTSTRVNQPVKIVALLTNNSIVDSLQVSLLNYLNNNPYSRQTKDSQKKILQDRLAFIDKELLKLDTLKINYNRFLIFSKISSTFYNNAFDPAAIYEHSNELTVQKETITKWLNNEINPILLVDGFKTPTSPQTFSLNESLFIGGLVGLLFGFILALMTELKKRVVN